METRIFDADGHVIEPTDLYFDRLDPAFRHRVQVDRTLGERHGRLFPLLDGKPSFGGSEWMRDYLSTDEGSQVLIDRFGAIAEAGFDPPAMLRALDAQSIEIAALFPSFSLHVPYTEHVAPDLGLALARAYNRWVSGFSADGDGRLLGVAVAPLHDPEGIAKEIRYAVEREGAPAVMVGPNPVSGRPLHHVANGVVFSVLEELEVPLLLHEGRGGGHHFAGNRFDTWYATHVVSHPFEMMLALLGLIVEGVFDRHPPAPGRHPRVGHGMAALVAAPHGRAPRTVRPAGRPEMLRKPSEYFAKHCVIASDSDDKFVASTVAAVGSDHVAWSSDFPHLEARWPDGVEIFDARAGFDAQTRASVMWRTPCRLYGLDPAPRT
jgi:predicted TIM-barrel fold metal-dependent hydrolase